ncbi:Para-nitrobenzyl esterase [Actinomadura sp. RB68]|uniref:Carboxylic ester hydrolase n=1 Tax=Actinomadura macrotermitis TaxID=2585200 RepID=A0A7K0C6L6_9ACTN|nr:Para-nitrobenzyl esterase [Actinomadura macrotermitis]
MGEPVLGRRRRTAGPVWAVTALVTCCLSVPAVGASVTTGGADPVARTDLGPVRGVATGHTELYQGIPYAQPPTGSRRWRPPVRPRPWTAVRDASKPGPACAQLDETGGVAAHSSEDCLYLNVTAPRGNRSERRPVVVYLHGGAFSSGSGSDFDARRMAATGGVVVVTVNSRLGVFGFFGHPRMAGSGTYALADQQAALRWVRANAQAFGGDPGNVTLMGESSGGASVCAQLVSPPAAGLFHRAIIQSGSCLQSWPKNMMAPGLDAISYWAPRTAVQARGAAAAAKLGCTGPDGPACLRRTDTGKLLALNGRFVTPAFGTRALPTDPVKALRTGAFQRVPVLQGNTRDEHRLFGSLFEAEKPIDDARYRALLATSFGERTARRVYVRYPPRAYSGRSGSPAALAWAAVGTDVGWVCPTLAADRLLARHVPVFSFEFAEPNVPDFLGVFPKGYPPGAFHGSELPMFFDIAGTSVPLGPAQRKLSESMIMYWAAFAAQGDPNRAGLPRWPRFPATQALDSARAGISRTDLAAGHHCRFWAARP